MVSRAHVHAGGLTAAGGFAFLGGGPLRIRDRRLAELLVVNFPVVLGRGDEVDVHYAQWGDPHLCVCEAPIQMRLNVCHRVGSFWVHLGSCGPSWSPSWGPSCLLSEC